jgi:hypothetical protein
LEGPVLVSYNIDNNKNNLSQSGDENPDLSPSPHSPSPTGNFKDTFTMVYHGSGDHFIK